MVDPKLFSIPDPETISPPVSELASSLPLNSISWESFERLCTRLAATGATVESTKRYGVPGQAQRGLDIIVRMKDGTRVAWQCKRYKKFSAKQIKAAVDKYLKEREAFPTTKLVLAVATSLQDAAVTDEVMKQEDRLQKLGIKFDSKGSEELGEELRRQPRLVHQFFGPEWLKAFCGKEVAESLTDLLTPEESRGLRAVLKTSYLTTFQQTDAGLPAQAGIAGARAIPLRERYVIPDLGVVQRRSVLKSSSRADGKPSNNEWTAPDQPANAQPELTERAEEFLRRPASAVIYEEKKLLILGEPGIGKTTLLRTIALDLLLDVPTIPEVAIACAGFLPVWLPFAFWTRLEPAGTGSVCPVFDAALAWIHQFDSRPAARALLERAFNSGQALLLVDGVDEWTSETTARSAMVSLNAFLDAHSLNALVTCRPSGYRRLEPFQEPPWKIVTLLPLTIPQQEEFCLKWISGVRQSDEGAEDASADDRAVREFLSLVRATPSLLNLTEVPLLLWALLSLYLAQHHLPADRIKAYAQLCEVVLRVHPSRRQQSALRRGQQVGLTEEGQKDAFADLAYQMLISGTGAMVSASAAKKHLEIHLERDHGYLKKEAKEQAEKLVNIGANELGVLVEASPEVLRFFHKSIQEYLAGRWLARMSLEEQIKLAKQFGSDPQWRDVLLTLVAETRRPDEKTKICEAIESHEKSLQSAQDQRDSLLTELAFGDYGLTPITRLRIEARALRLIADSESRIGARILENYVAMGELDSCPTIKAQLGNWAPRLHSFVSFAMRGVAGWPDGDDKVKSLRSALLSSGRWDRREVAEVYASCFAGDENHFQWLLAQLKSTRSPESMGAFLYCLSKGWANHPLLPSVEEATRTTPDENVRLAGLLTRIAIGNILDEDRKLAIEFGRLRVLHTQSELISQALILGWPRDEEIRALALDAVEKDRFDPDRMSREVALTYLHRTASSVEEHLTVAQCLMGHGYFYTHNRADAKKTPWSELVGNPKLIAIFEGLIESEKKSHMSHELASWAPIARSEKAKLFLLGLLNPPTMDTYWGARGLLEGWGMADPEVAAALKRQAELPEAFDSLASFLPKILQDPIDARRRLLKALIGGTTKRADLCADGLADSGAPADDSECVAVLLPLVALTEGNFVRDNVVRALFEHFSEHPDVRALALEEINRPEGVISQIAWTYQKDHEIRSKLASTFSALEISRRKGLIEVWSRRAPFDDSAFALLKRCVFDEDASMRCLAVIGCAEALQQRKTSADEFVDWLRAETRAIGPYMDERRQAGVAGLVALDCLTDQDLDNATEHAVAILRPTLERNEVLCQHIAQRWKALTDRFGDSVLHRLGGGRGDEAAYIENVAPYAAESGSLSDFFRRTLESKVLFHKSPGIQTLLAFARLAPTSPALKELCLNSVRDADVGGSWNSLETGLCAGRILGEHFNKDNDALTSLESMVAHSHPTEAVVFALLEGWPNHTLLQKVLKADKRGVGYNMAEALVVVRLGSSDDAAGMMLNMIARVQPQRDRSAFYPLRHLRQRIAQDETIFSHLLAALRIAEQGNIRVTLPRLLSLHPSIKDELVTWATGQMKVLESRPAPELGFDFVDQQIRPTMEVLEQLLLTSTS